jgi:predicted nucleotide-binding protein
MAKNSARRSKNPSKPKPAAPAYQVFVSHATTDKWIARMICEKIEACGAKTFRDDRDINGGDDIPNEIRREIKRSKEFVVLLTPESLTRQWVAIEVGVAWGTSKRKRIVAFMCHVKTTSIPDILKAKKAFHLNEMDQYLGELSERVKIARNV